MKKKAAWHEITDYDDRDVTAFMDRSRPMKLADIGFAIPQEKPSHVVSLRLPTKLINALKALGSQKDVPYQSLAKLILWDGVRKGLKGAGLR